MHSRRENSFAFISSVANIFLLQLKCTMAMCAFDLSPRQEKMHRFGGILLERMWAYDAYALIGEATAHFSHENYFQRNKKKQKWRTYRGFTQEASASWVRAHFWFRQRKKLALLCLICLIQLLSVDAVLCTIIIVRTICAKTTNASAQPLMTHSHA